MKTEAKTLSIHRFLPQTSAEGPGVRAALWVQGCPIRCPGCFNPQTWNAQGGTKATVPQVLEWILDAEGIQGVSFLGGEPFTQASALAELGTECQKHGLSVVTFTGYEHSAIQSAAREDWNRLLKVTDLLLAGPFLQARLDLTRPWIGSANQEFVFLTPRYRHLESAILNTRNSVEIKIDEVGGISLNGLLPTAELDLLEFELAELGLVTSRKKPAIGKTVAPTINQTPAPLCPNPL